MLGTVMLGTVTSATVTAAMWGFPVDDWQFWAGTLVFLGSLTVLLGPMLRRGKGKAPGCGGCAAAPPRSDPK